MTRTFFMTKITPQDLPNTSDCCFSEIEVNPLTNELFCTGCFDICDPVDQTGGISNENYKKNYMN